MRAKVKRHLKCDGPGRGRGEQPAGLPQSGSARRTESIGNVVRPGRRAGSTGSILANVISGDFQRPYRGAAGCCVCASGGRALKRFPPATFPCPYYLPGQRFANHTLENSQPRAVSAVTLDRRAGLWVRIARGSRACGERTPRVYHALTFANAVAARLSQAVPAARLAGSVRCR